MSKQPKKGEFVMICPHIRPDSEPILSELSESAQLQGPGGPVESKWALACEECDLLPDKNLVYVMPWPTDESVTGEDLECRPDEMVEIRGKP